MLRQYVDCSTIAYCVLGESAKLYVCYSFSDCVLTVRSHSNDFAYALRHQLHKSICTKVLLTTTTLCTLETIS